MALPVLSTWISGCVLDGSVIRSTEPFFRLRSPVPGLSLEKSRCISTMALSFRFVPDRTAFSNRSVPPFFMYTKPASCLLSALRVTSRPVTVVVLEMPSAFLPLAASKVLPDMSLLVPFLYSVTELSKNAYACRCMGVAMKTTNSRQDTILTCMSLFLCSMYFAVNTKTVSPLQEYIYEKKEQ